MRKLQSFSFALEDVFALYLNDSQPGYFVDIGCGHPLVGSNSKLLELNGWTGICIDRTKHAEWDRYRTTACHCLDATSVDYAELFRTEGSPAVISVLSIDVDDSCYAALEAIPFDNFEYKVVMIEHDFYATHKLRDRERALLRAHGYELVCSDVVHEPGKPFEDWWLMPTFFDHELFGKLHSDNELDIEIVRKFGYKNLITRVNGFNGAYPQVEIA